jgi:F0F1-type ATP synthase membrane subunit a
MLVRQVAAFDASGDWRSVGYGLLLVTLFVFIILSNAIMLAARVHTNFYGPKNALTAPT